MRRTWRNRFQPGFLPEDQTRGLATTMRRSVAPYTVEVHRMVHPSRASVWRVTGLVSPLEHPKPFAAVVKHLGHERHAFELTLRIESCKNLLSTAHLNPVA